MSEFKDKSTLGSRFLRIDHQDFGILGSIAQQEAFLAMKRFSYVLTDIDVVGVREEIPIFSRVVDRGSERYLGLYVVDSREYLEVYMFRTALNRILSLYSDRDFNKVPEFLDNLVNYYDMYDPEPPIESLWDKIRKRIGGNKNE